jgi:hypothetical protein
MFCPIKFSFVEEVDEETVNFVQGVLTIFFVQLNFLLKDAILKEFNLKQKICRLNDSQIWIVACISDGLPPFHSVAGRSFGRSSSTFDFNLNKKEKQGMGSSLKKIIFFYSHEGGQSSRNRCTLKTFQL